VRIREVLVACSNWNTWFSSLAYTIKECVNTSQDHCIFLFVVVNGINELCYKL
jgi:hypothetical protein